MTQSKIYPPPLAIVRALQPSRLLTAAQFQGLADVPPEIEWFANLGNTATRRAYENALQDFMRFTGVDGYQNPRDSGFLRDKPSKSSQPELDLEKSFRSGSVAELFTAQ